MSQLMQATSSHCSNSSTPTPRKKVREVFYYRQDHLTMPRAGSTLSWMRINLLTIYHSQSDLLTKDTMCGWQIREDLPIQVVMCGRTSMKVAISGTFLCLRKAMTWRLSLSSFSNTQMSTKSFMLASHKGTRSCSTLWPKKSRKISLQRTWVHS